MSENDSGDSFAAMFEREGGAPKRQRRIAIGERVEGVVVQVGRDAVFVEIDGKRQAFMELEELRDAHGEVTVKVGDTLTAHVVEVDEARSVIRLGRSMGKPGDVAGLEVAKESGVAVDGKVTGVNKGGIEVEVGGTRAFCPLSQVDARRLDDDEIKALVGQTLRFVVMEIKDGGRSVVLSRRTLLAREAGAAAAQALGQLQVGAVMRGTVTGVRDFGAFVDLGGVEGLIPRSEIAHDRSVAVADALRPGEVVEVQVHEIKEVDPAQGGGATRRITLSLKSLAPDPWSELDIVEGRVVEGVVMRITEHGRFVRVAPGVEGLLHVSESSSASEGEHIRVTVKKIDRRAKRISLAPAPAGAEIGAVVSAPSVSVGVVVEGEVTRIETYGVFVQIDGTADRAGRGLVPAAELGVSRGTDLRKAFPIGTRLRTKVLETAEGRIRLSVKAALDADERADFEEARSKQRAPATLGTFADLLKGRKL
ncbi:MAG: S1 RNA-binding domain-containing protein [Myxococcales bacterium]|nr:S1 RNA-binding domain-containing protein [Myxococcales bacterium]